MTSLVIVAYVVLRLAAIAHTVVKGSRAELRASGMTWILGGFLVAIVGTAARSTFAMNPPAWTGAMAIAAIPISMALAVRQHAAWERTRVSAVS